jgi:hypothetical protein
MLSGRYFGHFVLLLTIILLKQATRFISLSGHPDPLNNIAAQID